MKLFKGDINLNNGISLQGAIVLIESVFDHTNWEVQIRTSPERVTDENPNGAYYAEEKENQRQTFFTAAVFTSIDNYKRNLEATRITTESGSGAIQFNAPDEVAGMELLDAASAELTKLHPELTPI